MSRHAVPSAEHRFVDSSGTILRKAREALGLTTEEVATELRLSPYQIRALESDDYDALPGATYVRGYLRAYARLLNLNQELVLESALPSEAETQSTVQESAATEPKTRARFAPRPVALLLLLLLMGLLGLWWYSRESGLGFLAADRAIPPLPERVPAHRAGGYLVTPDADRWRSPPSDDLVSTKRRALFRFGDTSWIDVRDGAGKILVQQTIAPGLTLAVEGDPPFRVFLGNAAAVEVHYAGEPVAMAPRQGSLYARFTLGMRTPPTR